FPQARDRNPCFDGSGTRANHFSVADGEGAAFVDWRSARSGNRFCRRDDTADTKSGKSSPTLGGRGGGGAGRASAAVYIGVVYVHWDFVLTYPGDQRIQRGFECTSQGERGAVGRRLPAEQDAVDFGSD